MLIVPALCISGIEEDQSPLTLDKCVTLCSGRGYAYAGLKAGSKCLCDNTYGFHGPTNSKWHILFPFMKLQKKQVYVFADA